MGAAIRGVFFRPFLKGRSGVRAGSRRAILPMNSSDAPRTTMAGRGHKYLEVEKRAGRQFPLALDVALLYGFVSALEFASFYIYFWQVIWSGQNRTAPSGAAWVLFSLSTIICGSGILR